MNKKLEFTVIDIEEDLNKITLDNFNDEDEDDFEKTLEENITAFYKKEQEIIQLCELFGIGLDVDNDKTERIEYLENQLNYRITQVRSLAAILIVACIVWAINIF